MKKKILIALLSLVAIFACAAALTLTACKKGDDYSGTYYLFDDEEYDKSDYFVLDGKNWRDSNGMSGTYKIKDGEITFYVDFFGENVEWMYGEIGNGKLVVNQMLAGKMTYYKEGYAHTHEFGEWQVVLSPTCTRPGEQVRVCKCGEKDSMAIPALGHDTSGADIVYVPATCQSGGSITGTCKRCNELIVEDIPVKSTSHYIEEGKSNTVCSGCGTALASSLSLSTDNGEVTVTAATGTHVILPAVYSGKPVTTIGRNAFSGCTSLESIEIPDSVTTIGSNAFRNCTSLTSIVIPDSVTSIGGSAFYNCTSLTSVTIPDSVTSIGGSAFCHCTSLKSVTIPDGVTSIGEDAFYNCASLESITVDGDNQNYSSQDGILYNKTKTRILHIPKAIKGNVTIPQGITSIGDAFRNCASLESIEIPDSVTAIGSNAFQNCTSLTSIEIPNSVASIGSYAFDGCTSLTSIEIPDSVTSIGKYAFENCSSLEGVYITDLAAWCKIKFDTDSHPLRYADKLYLNKNLVTNITADMLQGVTEIGSRAFEYCTSLTSIEIPDSVTEIGDLAFYGCTSLESVTIPNGVTSIGNYAFEYCTKLTSITIPGSVTSIGDSAFWGCDSLESIEIPDSVTTIGERAFEDCTSLEGVYITDLAAWCKIEFGSSDANPLYYAHNLYLNKNLVTNITADMLQGITSIGDAFRNCASLESIEIPDSVTEIGSSAFYNCTKLTSVTIGNGVTTIGSSAFSHCTKLTSVTIGSGVTEIGERAFYYCDSLTSVTFANTTGWKVSTSSSMSNSQSAPNLSNPTQNAKYLRSTYFTYYWKRG